MLKTLVRVVVNELIRSRLETGYYTKIKVGNLLEYTIRVLITYI